MRVETFGLQDGELGLFLSITGAYGQALSPTVVCGLGDPRLSETAAASLPLDVSTGHGPGGTASGYGAAYSAYGADLTGRLSAETPAIALRGRLVMVRTAAGPPVEVVPGCWALPFDRAEVVRAVFHQAFLQALAEIRDGYAALRDRTRGPLSEALAARILETTPSALRRALFHPDP